MAIGIHKTKFVDFQSLFSTSDKQQAPTTCNSGKLSEMKLDFPVTSLRSQSSTLERDAKHVICPQEGTKKLLAWAADIHFDMADQAEILDFMEEVNQQNPSMLLLAGDIDLGKKIVLESEGVDSEILSNRLASTILKIKEKVECDVYFVCGNHDFFYSSFGEVRESARKLSEKVEGISYIHETKGVELDKNTVLVGHDGWADSRSGKFWESPIVMRDFIEIEDFEIEGVTEIRHPLMKKKLEELGDESAKYAQEVLPQLLEDYDRVVFVTHVPPFRESSWYQGEICQDEGAPFFVNQVLGETLVKIMEKHPEKELLVLCGHTHSEAKYQPLPNLTVLTAGARYGKPAPQVPIRI